MEVGGGETAFYDAEVVADRPGDVFICCDEGLCDNEGEFWGGWGEMNGASG